MSAYIEEGIITFVKEGNYAFAATKDGDVFCHFSRMTGTPQKGEKVFVFPNKDYNTGKIRSEWTICQSVLYGQIIINGKDSIPNGHYIKCESSLMYVQVGMEVETQEVFSFIPNYISRNGTNEFFQRSSNKTIGETERWASPNGAWYDTTFIAGERVVSNAFGTKCADIEARENAEIAARKEAEVAAKEEQERINTLPADVVVHVYWDCDDCQDMYGYSAHAYLEPNPPMEGNKDREYYYERRDFEEDSILLDKCDIFLNKFTMYDGIPQQTIIDDKVVKFIQH